MIHTIAENIDEDSVLLPISQFSCSRRRTDTETLTLTLTLTLIHC